MTREHDTVAHGLATALVAGEWTHSAMRARAMAALGRKTAPKWLDALITEVTDSYRDRPADRPRELAGFLQHTATWPKAWATRRRPHIVAWTPVPTEVTQHPWPVEALPDHAALARLLGLDQGELAWFADVRGLERTVPEPLRHYVWTRVAKRDGVRIVAAPKARLKEIQRRLLRHVIAPIPAHPAAHGAEPGHSVRTAVTPHVGGAVVIRLDLAGFFTSIPAGRIWNLLQIGGVPEGVAHTLTGLVTTVAPRTVAPRAGSPQARPHLPTGAPTSPALANRVAFTLDRRLTGLAARFDAQYTRYVDDLTFSGGTGLRNARARFVQLVETIVRSEGFRLNERKTVVLGRTGRQAVLGTVVNDHPTVPRPERDALRALLHNCAVYGWRSQARGRENFPDHVRGRIAWLNGLDPVLGTRLRSAYDAIDWS